MTFLSVLMGFSLSIAYADEGKQSSAPVDIKSPKTGAMHITAHLTINVQQPDEKIKEMIKLAEGHNGYYSSCSSQDVHFKIPPPKVEVFLAELKGKGILSEFDYSTTAIETELENTRARIQAREGMIEQYMSVLKTARLEAIVMVEREVLNLISQIEHLKGRLRILEHQAEYADINISLRFRDRRAPINDGSSPFEWINALNFYDLINDAKYPADGRHKSNPFRLPEGFSPFRKGNTARAATADGVLYQSYPVKNTPEADIAFWAGAVETRMKDAGYHSYTTDGTMKGLEVGPAYLFQYSAPLGVNDYAYWIRIEAIGNKVWITEVTGELSTFSGHEDAIKTTLSSAD